MGLDDGPADGEAYPHAGSLCGRKWGEQSLQSIWGNVSVLDRDPCLECALWSRQRSYRGIDRLPSVLILKLLRAQVAKGRVEPAAVTELLDKRYQIKPA